MKNAFLTCGLFSMMMILTSFTDNGGVGGNGNQGAPKPKLPNMEYGGIGNQGVPKPKLPMEFGGIGNQGVPRPGLPVSYMGADATQGPKLTKLPSIGDIGGIGNQGSQLFSHSLS